MKNYAPFVLRVALGIVVVWFGIDQLAHTADYFGFLPDWTSSLPITNYTLVHLNGWFEVVFGLALIFGFYTRLVSALLALHLLEIMYTVGYDAIGVRDFGLAFGMVSVFLYGPDSYGLDVYLGQGGYVEKNYVQG